MTDNLPQQWAPGRALQQARERAGLSKREAAKRADLSSAYYRWIEYGSRTNNGVIEPASPTPEALFKCSVAVGADPYTVLRLAGMDANTVKRRHLHEVVDRIPAEMIEPALQLLKGLVKEKDV